MNDLPVITTCSNCKFWKTDEFGTPGFGTCETIKHNDHKIGYDNWLREDRLPIETVEEIRQYQRTHKAATQDYENYNSWLITRHDFGCVLHEQKND